MAGFYTGWWQELMRPLLEDPRVVMTSARLLDRHENVGPMMFRGDLDADTTDVPRVPTACIAFRNDGLRFNEAFIGSGFEDDDFCAQIARKYDSPRFVINNKVRLIHINEMKNQTGEYYQKNKITFNSIWKTTEDNTARVDPYWNIPKILHFVWIGCKLPAWAEKNIAEFKRLNPEFEVMVHGEEILLEELKEIYAGIKHKEHGNSMRSDLLRLSALAKHGGWYFDVDFWPLISIASICAQTNGLHKNMLLFSSHADVVANGVIACRRDCQALKDVIAIVKSRKMHSPEWWDYGTWCTHRAYHNQPERFNIQPLEKIIPIGGKENVLQVMKDQEKIDKIRSAGAWAIHFEMQDSLDFDTEI
jgi:hypothetical protein